MSFGALSNCLAPHNGFLFFPEHLYILLDPDQFVLLCYSFNFLCFLVPGLHLDLIEVGAAMDDLKRQRFPRGDWCEAPPLVWVELAAPPFYLEPAAVDMLAGCGWTCGIVLKVGCSTPSAMVARD
jgi:hypothetical protein